jgi:HNH endonuclease
MACWNFIYHARGFQKYDGRWEVGGGMTEQELFEEVAKVVDYNPETGSMVWRRREHGADSKRWNKRHAGKECGCILNKGYRMLGYTTTDGKLRRILVHRLAWYIAHNATPKGEIDHIDAKKANNRITNLRDVPLTLNRRNLRMRRDNTSGTTGVTWSKGCKKWAAQVYVARKNHYLGYFDDIFEAEAAVKAFRAKHGFTDAHGERI